MQRPLHLPDSSTSRPGYLAEVTLALMHIRDQRASGRLSIRNGERFGLAHLYFKQGRLVSVTGDKSDGEIVLNDLRTWSKGNVRFDAAAMLTYENLTWQQAQLFTRWLSFLEMRGLMQGIPHSRLDGLAQSLSASLPGQPIALPQEVEHYEEHEEATRARQRQQLQQASQSARRFVGELAQQASDVTQELAKRAVKATQEGIRHATELAQETFHKVQSTQHSGDTARQTSLQRANETTEASSTASTAPLRASSSTSEQRTQLLVRSIRPLRSIRPPAPVPES